MSADEYDTLRGRVHAHLLGVFRRWLGEELKLGALRLTEYEAMVRHCCGVDAVDAVLEYADDYARIVVSPLWQLPLTQAESVPGMVDYLEATSGYTRAQNESAAAFFDAVHGAFDAVREEHAAFIGRRTAALMAWLERTASSMTAERVERWARYGMRLDASSDRTLSVRLG